MTDFKLPDCKSADCILSKNEECWMGSSMLLLKELLQKTRAITSQSDTDQEAVLRDERPKDNNQLLANNIQSKELAKDQKGIPDNRSVEPDNPSGQDNRSGPDNRLVEPENLSFKPDSLPVEPDNQEIMNENRGVGSESNSTVAASSRDTVVEGGCWLSLDEQDGREKVVEEGSGWRYKGEKVEGLRDGKGKLEYNDGGFYEGQWVRDKMHGFGRLYYAEGKLAYEGFWRWDQFDGQGRVYNDEPSPDKSPFDYRDFSLLGNRWLLYEGEFRRDEKFGKGTLYLSNGEYFEGTFLSTSLEGLGAYHTLAGAVVKGTWLDNKLVSAN